MRMVIQGRFAKLDCTCTHMLHVENYIVMCFDQPTYDLVNHNHRVLMLEDIDLFSSALNNNSDLNHHQAIANSNSSYTPSKQDILNDHVDVIEQLHLNVSQFENMMNAKYAAIASVLLQNISMLWTDADCLLLRKCSLSIFKAIPSNIDIIGQQGRPVSLCYQH